MYKMKIFFILFVFGFLFSFWQCKEESFETKGVYVGNNYYLVIAYGKSSKDVKRKVIARNMAKEAALIEAQRKIQKEFRIPQGTLIKSGKIRKVEFINNNVCRIEYIVNVKDIKALSTRNDK
ncbi:MAG: hypothetical protein ACTSQJ_19280 [Promethearchaeota archaeon]